MTSLGANVTIPDQIVLVGGTGKHLSDRFNFTHDDEEELDPRYKVRLSNGKTVKNVKNAIQDRLGPRRFNGNEGQLEDPYLDPYAPPRPPPRPHVLKRLGQPYSPWRTDQNAFDQETRGRRGGRFNAGYGNYYGQTVPSRYNGPGGASTYSYYSRGAGYSGGGGYGGGGSAPYSGYPNYGGFSKPRFNNYSYYNPYQFRGAYGGNYRGRYNTYAPRARGGRRGGRFIQNDVNVKELDRELDDYRSGKKEDSAMA